MTKIRPLAFVPQVGLRHDWDNVAGNSELFPHPQKGLDPDVQELRPVQ